ncbi:MAG: DUF6514 family protein [Oscillospiraceae bacterium]|nr:DUF6514 family protein [Oscillospiraceae bacterium]MDD4413946.1 DUF6514 family protein [Oscillospiraceae bacterium]
MNTSNVKNIKIHYNQRVYLLSYCLIKGTLNSDELGDIDSYGLQAKLFYDNQNNKVDDVEIADICSHHKDAMDLYDMVIKNNVFPVHLRDVVMDNIP